MKGLVLQFKGTNVFGRLRLAWMFFDSAIDMLIFGDVTLIVPCKTKEISDRVARLIV